jgi:hypothetical protein
VESFSAMSVIASHQQSIQDKVRAKIGPKWRKTATAIKRRSTLRERLREIRDARYEV